MKDTIYVLATRSGISGITKKPPRLNSGEYAVKLNVEIPDSVFDQWFPEANVQLDESDVDNNKTIKVEKRSRFEDLEIGS